MPSGMISRMPPRSSMPSFSASAWLMRMSRFSFLQPHGIRDIEILCHLAQTYEGHVFKFDYFHEANFHIQILIVLMRLFTLPLPVRHGRPWKRTSRWFLIQRKLQGLVGFTSKTLMLAMSPTNSFL